MMHRSFRILWSLALILWGTKLGATHNRAGEIIYRHVTGLKYEIEIITYTAVGDNNANRPVLGIDYDDGSSLDSIKRTEVITNFNGDPKINKNRYVTTHTFPGPGTYTLSMEDPNRNAGVINMARSVEQRFYIESVLNIPAGKFNNSPNLRYPPIATACLGYPFIYNPGAVDPDLDSLVYSLQVCKGIGGNPIPSYTYPDASKIFTIDQHTGTVTWDAPVSIGEYNIAILIDEYRREVTGNGKIGIFHVGSVLRDMQIEVIPGCTNRPPEIQQQQDYCITAGDRLTFSVIAADTLDGKGSNGGDSVFFEAVGGPFEIPPLATLTVFGEKDPITGLFDWITNCSHVKKRPYIVNFRAQDNGIPPLSNYMVTNILVVAPPVDNVQATPKTSSIELKWDPEICAQAIGYRIYRKLGPSNFEPDSCLTGLPDGIGFELIHENEDRNETIFVDDNKGEGLIAGEIYCYRIVAYFADGAESYTSEEVCAKLKKDVPILTNVDVRNTDPERGSIYVAWSKPNEHDTILYPGPYKYRIWRASNRTTSNLALIDSTPSINDTIFIDTNLNTAGTEYMYRIEMLDYSQGFDVSMGYSVVGTSVFINAIAKDNELILVWNEKVPWRNQSYAIYRKAFFENEFGSTPIATTKERTFRDTKLSNGKEYCYYVVSSGEYSLPGIAKPLFNRSQQLCALPEDKQAPCAPEMHLTVDECPDVKELLLEDPDRCGYDNQDVPGSINYVKLDWTNPNDVCDTTDDVIWYDIYWSVTYGGKFERLVRHQSVEETSFVHFQPNSRAGCYYVTAIDSFENISPLIDTVCSDNCFIYELPNVFTPNGDGVNDLFRPFPYCFVKSVNCKIVSRWGLPVFETTDPDILWDGTNTFEGNPAPDGVYFYTCSVEYISVFGTQTKDVKGVVHLLGNGKSGSKE